MSPLLYRSIGRPARWAFLAAAPLAFASCDAPASGGGGSPEAGAPGAAATLRAPAEAVRSPAGEGSGEPHLSSGEDGPLLSWLVPNPDGSHALRVARWTGEGWGEPLTVTTGEGFFVNWADFPSVVEIDGVLVAHWLERGDAGGYDYGVKVALSGDGGRTWSAALTPHADGTPTEHGFVSTFRHPGGGAGVVWLDGRRYHDRPGAPATEEMTLRARSVGPGGELGPERLLDGRTCDCCQTDAALTDRGPVVVYRDRSAAEIRDIYVARLVDGRWTEGVPVHEDGWEIAACPVNGPAVDAAGDDVVVAWFTAAGDTPSVSVAFSGDAGATFGSPVRLDGGRPAGRVDVSRLSDGSAVVSWIERVGDGDAELRVRRVDPDGRAHASSVVAGASAQRAGGFPQMLLHGGRLLFAWTDVSADGGQRVRTAVADPGAP